MKQLLALITVLLVSTPAYCADREEARVRVREAAYQAIQRHQVTSGIATTYLYRRSRSDAATIRECIRNISPRRKSKLAPSGSCPQRHSMAE